jgi:hypothetical protein
MTGDDIRAELTAGHGLGSIEPLGLQMRDAARRAASERRRASIELDRMLGRSAYPDPAVLYNILPSREPVGEVR